MNLWINLKWSVNSWNKWHAMFLIYLYIFFLWEREHISNTERLGNTRLKYIPLLFQYLLNIISLLFYDPKGDFYFSRSKSLMNSTVFSKLNAPISQGYEEEWTFDKLSWNNWLYEENLNPYLTPHTKTNFRFIKNLNVKS